MGDNRTTPLRPPFGQSPHLPPLPLKVISKLGAEAEERGKTVDELVVALLVNIVEDDLFEAVLGD